MASDLKPCPFCGCKYEKDDDDFWYSGDHEDWCPLNAEFYGRGSNLIVPDVEESIAAWNRRAGDAD